jgi:cysteine-rich repeat protein
MRYFLISFVFGSCTILTHAFQKRCGDGFLQFGEDCDDGRNDDFDGCDSNCTFENNIFALCGNGLKEEREFCYKPPLSLFPSLPQVRLLPPTDLNADGLLDLFVVSGASGQAQAFINEGVQGFSAQLPLDIGNNPQEGDLGDLNNDGFVDAVIPLKGDGKFVTLLGDGRGNFSLDELTLSGSSPSAAIFAELDNQAGLDVVVTDTNNTLNGLLVFLNKGDGTFQAKAPLAGNSPIGVVAADLDGDEDLDLAASNNGDNGLNVFLNDGVGNFSLDVELDAGVAAIHPMAADFDSDSLIDLAVVGENGAVPGSVAIFLNSDVPGPTFSSASTFSLGNGPNNGDLGDVDGDNVIDLAVPNTANNNVIVRFGNGDGRFINSLSTPACKEPSVAEIADIDDDNDNDIIASCLQTGDIAILRNDAGTLLQTDADALATGVKPRGRNAVGDFDGDEDLDLIVTNSNSNALSLFLGDGTSLAAPTNLAITGGAFGADAAQLDGDPEDEFVVALPIDHQVLVFLSLVDVPLEIPVINTPQSPQFGDVDKDGDQDIVVAFPNVGNGGEVGIFFNIGSPTNPQFSTLSTNSDFITTGSGAQIGVLGDIDGDQDLDLAVPCSTSNEVTTFKNTGGIFAKTTDLFGILAPDDVAFGDIDGDQEQDLLVAARGSNTLPIFLNKGGGTFDELSPIEIETISPSLPLFVEDFNNDGSLDVWVANSTTNRVSIFFNKEGTFEESLQFNTTESPNGGGVGDFNNDKVLDVAIEGNLSNDLILFFSNP